MVRFKLYVDKDEETEFLNNMSMKGYAMTGFCAGFYHFDECPPGEYIYQIDITEGLFRVSNDYREFMREMGVEIVCLWGPWVILRKRAVDGPFVLYTDVESNIEHYTKIRKTFKICSVLEIMCICVELLAAVRGITLGWVFSLVLGAMLVVLLREVVRINGILADLKERIGMDCGNGGKTGRLRRGPSLLLAAGMFLNGIALLLPELGRNWILGFSNENVKISCQIVAIALMVAGIVRTCQRGRE